MAEMGLGPLASRDRTHLLCLITQIHPNMEPEFLARALTAFRNPVVNPQALQPLYSDICCVLLPNAAAQRCHLRREKFLKETPPLPLPKLGVNE